MGGGCSTGTGVVACPWCGGAPSASFPLGLGSCRSTWASQSWGWRWAGRTTRSLERADRPRRWAVRDESGLRRWPARMFHCEAPRQRSSVRFGSAGTSNVNPATRNPLRNEATGASPLKTPPEPMPSLYPDFQSSTSHTPSLSSAHGSGSHLGQHGLRHEVSQSSQLPWSRVRGTTVR